MFAGDFVGCGQLSLDQLQPSTLGTPKKKNWQAVVKRMGSVPGVVGLWRLETPPSGGAQGRLLNLCCHVAKVMRPILSVSTVQRVLQMAAQTLGSI